MLRYLRTFLIAAETASFSAAGERLGLTQSAVSLQMRKLEEDLGCQLFERTGKSVRLGPEGRRIMADAARMLALYEGMRGQASGDAEPATLDIGAISTAQATLLPRALQQFRRHHPAIHINIVPGMSVQLLSQVDTQELDLAVMIRPRLGIPPDLKWLGLAVKKAFVQDADHATVEFVARSRQAGRAHRLHELSRFVREDGRWYYVDGDLN